MSNFVFYFRTHPGTHIFCPLNGNLSHIYGHRNFIWTRPKKHLCSKFLPSLSPLHYGIVYHNFIPMSRMVNKEIYVDILRRLRDAIIRNRLEKCKTVGMCCTTMRLHIDPYSWSNISQSTMSLPRNNLTPPETNCFRVPSIEIGNDRATIQGC